MALVTEAYTRIVPIAQNAVAGNNAHSFDPNTGIIQLGTHEEPIFLHGHVFGRGNPEERYIEDVSLDGPIPGLLFDMRAQTSQERGNDKKVSWQSDDTNKVVRRLKTEIESICDTYKTHGLIVITRNISFDIYIVRHGETDWNIQSKLQGHTDISLNTNGKQQAQQLQEKFVGIDFTKVFSSDLTRARTTAEIIFGPNKTINIIETLLLREKSMGIWEGRLITELRTYLKQNFDLDHLTQDEYLSFKWGDNVESYADVYQRIQTLIRSIIVSSSVNDGPILFSTHGGVFRSILYNLNFHAGYQWQVTNGAILKLRVQMDGHIDIMSSEGVKLVKAAEATCSF